MHPSRRHIASLLLPLLAFLACSPTLHAADAPTARKAILVTGASTGIGRSITGRLAAEGHFVYAGARKDADLAELNRIPNVEAVRLDVTNPADIAAAVSQVERGGRGLHALVNNAGVAVSGPLATMAFADLEFVTDVNVYGPFRVTQAFAPLIIASGGRVTTIGSISGVLSGRNFGAYSMSKHAIEAYTDSLASELEPQGVRVSVVEPGNYASDIGRSAAARAGRDPAQSTRDEYKQPDEVAAAVSLALFEPAPKRRYMVVPNEQEAAITIGKAIEELVQLNEGQAYTYSRAELIGKLDEALKEAKPRRP